MARPLRIEYEGAWYHVMNRGAGRHLIFPDDVLRREFLSLVGDIYDMYQVCCHAYCLMGNHYHLLLQTRCANLGRAMRHLDGVYTQRHNYQQQTDGPLFRGRYKAQLIERDSYLLRVSRYVHRNPIAAGLCERLNEYPWSSYPVYAGLRQAPLWLHLRETVATFRSVTDYCAFVEQGEDDELADPRTDTKVPPVLGSQAFVEACRQRWCNDPDYEIPQAKTRPVSASLAQIIEVVSEHTAIPQHDLIAAADRRTRAARAMAMSLGRQHGGCTLREIADAFGIASYTTVASAISRYRKKVSQNANLARQLACLQMRIRGMRNA